MDKWLWHARMVRTRPDAVALISSGHVRLNGVREKSPAHEVKPGDVLTLALSGRVRVIRVLDFAARRGEAGAAQTLYVDLQSSSD
jgi:ribosome-associated heat shock protein Hsp15